MKNKASIFLFTVFFMGCIMHDALAQNTKKDTVYKLGDFLIHASETMKIDFVVKGRPVKPLQSIGDTLFDDDKYLILGNSDKLIYYKPRGVLKKYTLAYQFSNYKVGVYKGKLASPDFKTDPAAYEYRTKIKSECKTQGINFAGHFTLTHWGCGSDCEAVAIVDRVSGKIFFSNLFTLDQSVFFRVKCKPDSKMLLINDWLLDDVKGYLVCSDKWKLAVARWDNSKFKFLLNSL
jgi:hypothetical protein